MSDDQGHGVAHADLLRMTTEIVSAYLSRNPTENQEITTVITHVFAALNGLGGADASAEDAPRPAVSVRRSVTPDYIVCLEDGRKLKMLKRHLRTAFNMTPEEYRTRWDLPKDYPMVAPNYAKRRSEFAKKMGLGKK